MKKKYSFKAKEARILFSQTFSKNANLTFISS